MQVSTEAGEGLERRMTVTLPAERLNQAIEERLQDMVKNVRLDGFRPGKVPMRVIRQRFSQSVRQEVMGDLIQNSFFEAAEKEGHAPAGMPRIDDVDLTAGRYTAVFEVMPEIALADMSAAEIKRPQVEITEADMDAMIEKLRQQRSSWVKVERPAEDGDQLVISFRGLLDGEVFPGGSAEDITLVLGSKSLIEGFESGLIGANAGEARNLSLKFPADYRMTELADKDVVFEVQVKEVHKQVLPEVDETFIKGLGVESGDMADFRVDIRKSMDHELGQRQKAKVKAQVMDAMLAANEILVPRVMIEQEAANLKNQTQQNMAQQGHSSSLNLPVEIFMDQAQRRVALGLLVGAIIKQNDIKLDQERLNKFIEDFAESYDDPDEVVDYYSSNKQARSTMENLVMEDQVVDWLLERVKVVDEPMDFDVFMNDKKD
jgi:trigger factor